MFDNDPYVRKRFELYAALLKPYLKSGVKILDVGGYTADLLVLLKKSAETADSPTSEPPEQTPPGCSSAVFTSANINYHVTDFDKKALKVAKQRGAKVELLDFDKCYQEPFRGKKFHIIIMAEVLEHLIDPATFLDHVIKKLDKDGVVLISLPNENTIYHRMMSLLGLGVDSFAFKPYKHLHLPTISQSRAFVAKHLKVEKEAYWYHVGFQTTRTEWLGKVAKIVPEALWQWLANTFPTLFARGVVFLGTRKTEN